jgi:hypothetical protein
MGTNQPRKSAGTPVGGQWAPAHHDEADVTLREDHIQRGLRRSVAITRDDILSARDPKIYGRYALMGDNGRSYSLLSFSGGEGYAISSRTGLVVRVVRTGEKPRGSRVRARAVFPADTGDVAGTLVFDPKANGSIGGVISSDLASL